MPPSQANLPDRDFPAPEGPSDRGLLEQPLLRVGAEDGRGRRGVRDRAGRLVGLCHRLQRPWWWRWLGPVLRVYEAGDQPLVFSVVQALSLSRRQVVRDADGELIGTIDRRQLHDRWGRPLLRHRAQADGRCGQFEAAGGEVVARWAALDGETALEIHEGWLPGPFERMLVLAAALTVRG